MSQLKVAQQVSQPKEMFAGFSPERFKLVFSAARNHAERRHNPMLVRFNYTPPEYAGQYGYIGEFLPSRADGWNSVLPAGAIGKGLLADYAVNNQQSMPGIRPLTGAEVNSMIGVEKPTSLGKLANAVPAAVPAVNPALAALPWYQAEQEAKRKHAEIVALRNSVRSILGM